MINFKDEVEAIDALNSKYFELLKEIQKVIIGQEKVIKEVLISVFSKGHCLILGVPGLAKTLLVNTISDALKLDYKRIQFTPDLMPSDIIGTEILNKNKEFEFIKGPIFSNIILADEINRTPPKTQAALLEAMQEKNITAANTTYKLTEPFFVLATQNPIEQEGTYPLPEAQLDRFMFNVNIDYPSFEDEVKIVKETTTNIETRAKNILSAEEIIYYQSLIRNIPVNDNVIKYAVELVQKTRPFTEKASDFINEFVSWGAGPRASQYLILGAKTSSVFNGKYTPDIEDVKAVALSVLRHRIMKNYKADAENIKIEDILKKIL